MARRANLPELNEPAAVLTDVIEIGPRAFVKPLVIGLPNRHNVLFDLATARLAAWWTGDVARQQTRGKSWYWEAGVPQLLPAGDAAAAGGEFVLRSRGKPCEAAVNGQYLTEFDWLEHVAGGVEFGHRLRFQLEDTQTHTARHAEIRFAASRGAARIVGLSAARADRAIAARNAGRAVRCCRRARKSNATDARRRLAVTAPRCT